MSADDREASTCALVGTKSMASAERRRWPEALKRQLVAESFAPGASVSIVARRHDVNANQLFKWRRQFAAPAGGGGTEPVRLLPVAIAMPPPATSGEAVPDGAAPAVMPAGSIEIELRPGRRVRISGSVDPAVVTAALRVLTRR